MLPSPRLRPPQPSEQQRLATYLEAQQILNHGPTSYLLQPRRPVYRNNTPILNLYTPYRAHGSAPQIPPPVQQGASQEDLLRRKTPAGTLPDAYDGAPMEWPRRPTKHILLPLSLGMRNGQVHDPQKQAGSFQGVQQPALPVPIQPPSDTHYSRSESWANSNPSSWTNSGVNPTVSQNEQDFSALAAQPQLQTVSRQVEPIYNHGPFPPIFNPDRQTQQPSFSIQSAVMRDGFAVEGTGMGVPVTATGGWYMTDNGMLYPLEGYSPMLQQLNSPAYQINTPITPSSFREIPSFIGHIPSWTQLYRGNSGQAQTPQAINAPVTSPYPIAPYQPFVADPIHHTRGFDGTGGGAPVVANYIHNILPNRSRVLSWAHGVYADLVQSTQAHQVSQAGTQLLSRPPVRPLAQADTSTSLATYQHGLRNQQFTPTEASPNCTTPTPQANDPTEDNFDRRKKRRIDTAPETQTSSSHARRPRRNTAPGYSPQRYNSSGSVTPVDNSGFRESEFPKGDIQLGTATYQSNSQFDGGQYGHILRNGLDTGPQVNVPTPMPNRGAMVTSSLGTNGFGQIMGGTGGMVNPAAAKITAYHALDTLQQLCAESGWRWLDGMLLGGCIAYALSDLNRALGWYLKIIEVDPLHVEALSNLGATLLALGRRAEAEEYWLRAVKARPNYFEAVEHLVGLLCGEQRGRDAVALIEFVERSVKRRSALQLDGCDMSVCSSSSECSRASVSQTSSPEMKFDYYEDDEAPATPIPPLTGQPEYVISGADNGRLLGLIHAKGNMLYTLGDNAGAAKAFEDAVLIGAGREKHGIKGLIQRILDMLAPVTDGVRSGGRAIQPALLTPEKALRTAQLVFPPNGELPGLRELPPGSAMRIAISTTSNSLLSLAKIFQDGMSSSAGGSGLVSAGVKDILALYYLSLSLHPSPSTANNVGILLASVQQTSPVSSIPEASFLPGYTLGSGVGLALLYYQYGLMLDPRHAHLYTNLGSLLKDINNLPMAIKMYEQAVLCDGTFDIALANLANAVKDQGRTKEAIKFYKRAVAVSPNFAEAVCGLANALNSVCDWKGRGGVVKSGGALDRWHVNDDGSLFDSKATGAVSRGWMGRVVSIVEKQLEEGEHWGKGILIGGVLDTLLREVETAVGGEWSQERREALRKMVVGWAGKKNEGAKVVRLIERAVRRAGWRWYREKYIRREQRPLESYLRPTLPACLSIPSAPTVLPFHTFTCPLSAQQVRTISQRNGVRISSSTMRAPWLAAHVYPPPAPPSPHLNVGYISSDFNNHPLAHLMQSVFGMHDPSRVKAHCYATTPSDNSPHRLQIEREAPHFYDASCWGPDRLINQIIKDGIHILVNLNGFTRGAKNEIFAARPAPIQMSFMGFAGSLGADWCDYLLADDTAVPPDTVRPWRRNVDLEDGGHEDGDDGDWVYCENIVFTKYSFFCCDHRQSAPDAKGPGLSWDEELQRRWKMRKELFPDLPDDTVILGNFNQLYKIEPTTFRTWLRIIAKVPNTRLWLLRFPDLGEKNLRELAEKWAGLEVAKRIIFTDVAPKQQHIARARVCDIFLDTPECNAHTTAADVTWSGTPLLTLPRHKYKMCSRIAASIVRAAVPPTTEGKRISDKLIAESEEDYERRAVNLASGLRYERGSNGIATGELVDIRKVLFEGRWTSPLFDTKRWVQDLETAYELAWKRWVDGEGGDIRLQ